MFAISANSRHALPIRYSNRLPAGTRSLEPIQTFSAHLKLSRLMHNMAPSHAPARALLSLTMRDAPGLKADRSGTLPAVPRCSSLEKEPR